MSREIKFTLDGDPVPYAYKAGMRGGHPVIINKKKYQVWKDTVRWQVIDHKNRKRLTMYAPHVPLGISFTFRFTRPKSVKRKHHTVKPDLDNIIKPIKDALKGVLIHDDSQIVKYGEPEKIYCAPGEPPGISVTLWEIKD